MSCQAESIRVIIVDDHPMLRDGTKACLDQAGGVDVVAVASTGAEALRLVQAHRPDALLLDLRLPDVSGVEIARRVRERSPEVAIVVLTGYEQLGYTRALRELGVKGFLQKTASSKEIVDAVRAVAAGGSAFPDIEGSGNIKALSMRELEVLRLMVAGYRNADIVEELSISLRTVEYHVSNVLSKLGARSRADAVRIAHTDSILIE